MEKNDEELILCYRRGEEGALEELVEKYLKLIYNYTLRLTGDADAADDLTQEVFLKLWANLGRYKASGNFRSWLFSIAHNTIVDYLRKQRPDSFSSFDREDETFEETLVDPEPLPDAVVERIRAQKMLEGLLRELPVHMREVLLLHYSSHLTFDEIGEVLKKPLNTVKSHHRRAVILLKGLIEKRGFLS